MAVHQLTEAKGEKKGVADTGQNLKLPTEAALSDGKYFLVNPSSG